jgi:hypothetical protein
MVCSAVTKSVSISLCPPVLRLRENIGNDAEATSTRTRFPLVIVPPVCHRSSEYSTTSPGVSNSGFFIDFRNLARILPSTRVWIFPSASTSSSRMNQSVSFVEVEANITADTGPAKVRSSARGSD